MPPKVSNADTFGYVNLILWKLSESWAPIFTLRVAAANSRSVTLVSAEGDRPPLDRADAGSSGIRGSTSHLAILKGIQIMNATTNMNATMGEVFSAWVYESLNGPSLLGDDTDSAARVALRFLERTGVRVDYSSLESVRSSTAHLHYGELYALQHAARDCRLDETLYEIAVYQRNNPLIRVVAKPAGSL